MRQGLLETFLEEQVLLIEARRRGLLDPEAAPEEPSPVPAPAAPTLDEPAEPNDTAAPSEPATASPPKASPPPPSAAATPPKGVKETTAGPATPPAAEPPAATEGRIERIRKLSSPVVRKIAAEHGGERGYKFLDREELGLRAP